MDGGARKRLDRLSLSEKIRRLRKIRGFTQEQMAQKMDLSIRGYSKIELGETKLSVIRLFEIAELLDVSVHELLLPVPKQMELKSEGTDDKREERLRELYQLLEEIIKEEKPNQEPE